MQTADGKATKSRTGCGEAHASLAGQLGSRVGRRNWALFWTRGFAVVRRRAHGCFWGFAARSWTELSRLVPLLGTVLLLGTVPLSGAVPGRFDQSCL